MAITTVFGGGVHGVGKSSMFERVAKLRGVAHFSASSLIKGVRAEAISQNSKVALDVAGNQDLLVYGFSETTASHKGIVLLDGHFTLINKEGEVTDVPLTTFEKLHLQALVFVKDDPHKIYDRLIARDKRAPSVSQINEHQRRELIAAEAVARHLDIKLHEIMPGDSGVLNALITHTEKNLKATDNR